MISSLFEAPIPLPLTVTSPTSTLEPPYMLIESMQDETLIVMSEPELYVYVSVQGGSGVFGSESHGQRVG